MRVPGPWTGWIDRWKAYLDPRTCRTWRRLRRQRGRRGPAGDVAGGAAREVLIDITRHHLDRDVGRIAYFVCQLFRWTGFRVCLRDRYRFVGTLERKLYKRLILRHPFEIVPGPGAMGRGFWWVTDRDPGAVPEGCERLVLLDYEAVVPGAGEIILPYFFNPMVHEHVGGTDLARYRSRVRPYRVFFAGTVNRRYDRDTIPGRYGMLSRCQVLETVRRRFGPEERVMVDGYEELCRLGEAGRGRIVLLSPEAPLMTVEEWLTVLGRSEVLLAAPGVSMPLAHNLWEALALGTVPLLEYARQLVPPLEGGREAFEYAGADGLERELRRVLALGSETFEPMRAAGEEYYRRHGTVESFLARLEGAPEWRVRVRVFPFEAVRTGGGKEDRR